VVVTVGLTDTAAPPTGLLLAPVIGPVVESILTLVAPVTLQLKTVLCPLVMVENEAVKLAMAGASLKAVAAALFGRHPVMNTAAISNAGIRTARQRTRGIDREDEFV
jgi:hypothetical protein